MAEPGGLGNGAEPGGCGLGAAADKLDRLFGGFVSDFPTVYVAYKNSKTLFSLPPPLER